MNAIRIVSTGIVYRNPQPHLKSRHAFFPTAAELDSGELFVAFDLGSAFEAVDVRSYCSRSSDGGHKWSDPAPIFHPDDREHPVSTTCRVGRLDDGELLAWGCLFDRRVVDEGLVNPHTDGFCNTGFVTLRSRDAGQTWHEFRSVQLPTEWRGFETCAPPFSVGNERLLVATSAWPDWKGNASPWQQDGLAFVSNDNGATWHELMHVFSNGDLPIASYEQALTRLSDGRVLAVCWAYDRKTKQNLPNQIAFSSDARFFGPPLETPLVGETCRLLGLEDDRVLAVYRRVDQPGLWAQLAVIEGEQWTPLIDLPLWNGGAAYGAGATFGSNIARMSTLRFGCPAIVPLQNGEAFVVFWCVEDCVSVIRWFRLGIML